MTENHYGYGLRNDEVPFASKIKPGRNWKSLNMDDQKKFMKGAFGDNRGAELLTYKECHGKNRHGRLSLAR